MAAVVMAMSATLSFFTPGNKLTVILTRTTHNLKDMLVEFNDNDVTNVGLVPFGQTDIEPNFGIRGKYLGLSVAATSRARGNTIPSQ